MDLILPTDRHWHQVVATTSHDFYHLQAYHILAERYDDVEARLFSFREGPYVAAVPLLLRNVSTVAGLGSAASGWKDAVSVYGYSGPITSHAEIPAPVMKRFQQAFRESLNDRRVLTVFSRLHPLIDHSELLTGIGEVRGAGTTVSIDLTMPEDRQTAFYRKSHRYEITRLRRQGINCQHDEEFQNLGEFVEIYQETMRRVNAADSYMFDYAYFEQLVNLSKDDASVHLFVVPNEGHLMCGALFFACNGIVQYHLAGTRAEFSHLAPMKLVIDTVRHWATESGMRVFHLGGGVGSQEDSLFKFKAGFSDRRHEFLTWRWVLEPDAYREVCQAKKQWNSERGEPEQSPSFFPLYRAPAVTNSLPGAS